VSDRARIIELNDELRTAFRGGQVRMMPSIFELDARLCGRALCVMSRSTKFDRSGDHDRGRFVFAGYLFAWQIAYRSPDETGYSADPADPAKTSRLLTLCPTDDLLIRAYGGPQFGRGG
jgi:hypothetical protein